MGERGWSEPTWSRFGDTYGLYDVALEPAEDEPAQSLQCWVRELADPRGDPTALEKPGGGLDLVPRLPALVQLCVLRGDIRVAQRSARDRVDQVALLHLNRPQLGLDLASELLVVPVVADEAGGPQDERLERDALREQLP